MDEKKDHDMSATILIGDNRKELKKLPEKHFHCAITSPPYFGLRSYLPEKSPLKKFEIGLEDTPEKFTSALVDTFAELWRVLRDNGSLWLNLGDSYSNSGCGPRSGGTLDQWKNGGRRQPSIIPDQKKKRKPTLPKGNLIGIPWRVAFALQAAGWTLRSAIPWVKRNCMPESVTDRPASAVEYVFLLTKSHDYFYDHEAVKVAIAESSVSRLSQNVEGQIGTVRANGGAKTNGNFKATGDMSGRNRRNSDWFFESWQGLYEEEENPLGFVVNTSGFKDAHFATFPIELVKPMIFAGTSEGGCCSKCGAPRIRQIEEGEADREHQKACGANDEGLYTGQAVKDYEAAGVQNASETKRRILQGMKKKKTIGFAPSCECQAETVPCRVIDPFCGSATVGEVALTYKRDFTGIDLNEQYAEMQKRRTAQTSLL